MELNGTYQAVVAKTGIVPEQIYARCSSLTAFTFSTPATTRPKSAIAPRPGQKPVRKRK
jgi:hypothetical protein